MGKKNKEIELEKVGVEDDDDPELSDHQTNSKYKRKYVPGRGFERYNNSLKTLIPIRRKRKDQGDMPSDSAGLFSLLCISWLSKYMYKARREGLKIEDLPKVSTYDSCNYNADRLELFWNEELAKRGPEQASFSRVAWRFCKTRVLLSCIIQIFSQAFIAVGYTLCMKKLLEYIQSGGGSYGEGITWALLLPATSFARTLLVAWSWTLNYITGLRLRSACLTLVYRKIMSVDNLGNRNIGEVINVFSNDAQRMFDVTYLGPLIIEAPIMTAYVVLYVFQLFGPIGLVGILVFALFYPLQYAMSRLVGYLQTKSVTISDLRVRLMNEILDCIKLIKMYAWEKRFSKDLLAIRKKERRVLLNSSNCESFNISIAPIVPLISASVTFLATVSTGRHLTAAQVFPYSSFLDSRFRVALSLFQAALGSIVLGRVSFNRVKELLLMEKTECSVSKPILKSQAVAITNATFAYNNCNGDQEEISQANNNKRNGTIVSPAEKSEVEKLNKPAGNTKHTDVLFDVSFEAAKGKLVGICGQVGSGKSSLLLAALGQLRVSKGQVARDGSCAYVSQQAWITNATLRENILFGEKFDRDRYQKVTYACNLVQDIEMMPAGDRTEIGERGVNLSGGQKQRVALARALYADRDIYFLDDPLSAVDSRVGLHIFDNLILEALKEKTVLFVTHQIQYLNRCDDIYMMQNGRIIEHGTHDDLMKLGNEYALMVEAISAANDLNDETVSDEKTEAVPPLTGAVPFHEESQNHSADTPKHTNEDVDGKSKTSDAQLTVTENIQQGSVKAHTYHSYILAAGGYLLIMVVLFMFTLSVGSTVLSSWTLAAWIESADSSKLNITNNNETVPDDNMIDNPDVSYYQTVYALSIGMIVIITILCSFVFTQATIRASTNLHNNLFNKILSSPMRFFDTTPLGRIQHLFSRDMDEVDKKLPATLDNCIQALLKIIMSMIVICLVLPWFIVPFCILVLAYYFISKRYRVGIRDFKRMENKTRAPVISFVTASVQGLSTIHAFGKENDFAKKFANFFDENSKFVFMSQLSVRWLVIRMDSLSTSLIGMTALLIVIFKDQVPPALAGLSLAYTTQIAGFLAFSIRLVSETEVQFTSVERINNYLRILKGEGSTNEPTIEPPSIWPATAVIKFINVCMAYGEGAPIILKNVSFTVDAGEKIGIVGRTGSGKSSLTVALFRLVELAEGRIEIDGVDISRISLEQLRTKLSIIPQDPVLFSGTIRSNLDPFGLYTDAEIWKALEKTELKERVKSINGLLDASVGFGGDNWSVGERQLLCLARALLRNSKILVLDEATAAVDPETEIAVQNTVQREFSHCTILTIAHRLQTVLSLSRVLVMDDGKVLEFDSPSKLVEDQNSEFSKMVAAANQAESQ